MQKLQRPNWNKHAYYRHVLRVRWIGAHVLRAVWWLFVGRMREPSLRGAPTRKQVILPITALRICEVRIAETLKLNTNINCVFHIYAVSNSYLYGY